MAQAPAEMSKHMEVICTLDNGGLVLGATNLTGRYWNGSLWYWDNVKFAPDIEKCTAACEIDAGLVDLALIDSQHFLVGTDAGAAEVYELGIDENNENTLSCITQMNGHDDSLTTLSVCSTGDMAVTGAYDCCIKVWDLSEGTSKHSFKGHSASLNDVSCHPTHSDVFASCSQDGKVLVWDTRRPKPAKLVDVGVQDVVTCVEWLPWSEFGVVLGTESGTVHVQDIRKDTGPQLTTYPHTRAVTRMQFSHHRKDWLSTASEDCSVTVQYVASDDLSSVWKSTRHKDFARCAAWSRTDETLYSCSWDNTLLAHTVQPSAPSSPDEDTIKTPADVKSTSQGKERMETECAVVNGQ